jgi:hypothetical protein
LAGGSLCPVSLTGFRFAGPFRPWFCVPRPVYFAIAFPPICR